MWCCRGPAPVDDSEPIDHRNGKDPTPKAEEAAERASEDVAEHVNGLGNGLVSDQPKTNGQVHNHRRESQDSDVFFDAEENFIEEHLAYVPVNGTKTKASAASQVYLASGEKEGFENGNGAVADAPASAPSESDSAAGKTKETLALEEIREFFSEYNLPDQTYCRYLRARHWDVKKATKLIQNYVEWRAEMQPESIQWDDIEEEFRTGKVYRLHLSDFKNRHVVILSPGKQNTNNHQQQMKQLVYTMESAIGMKAKEDKNLMDVAPVTTPASEQLIVLLDFTGYTLRNAPPFKTSLETLKILQDYYCERLGEAMLLNPPSVFRVLWKLIRPFIDKRTLRKISFLPRNFKECDILKERFNLDDLDTALGGRGDFPYDHDKYGAMMKAEDEVRKNRPPLIPPRPSTSSAEEDS